MKMHCRISHPKLHTKFEVKKMGKNTFTITDNRTGKSYEIPVTDDTIRAMDLRQIKVNDDDFGTMSYDPAYKNTASTRSKITFIDGAKGILRYRGYPIEEIADKTTFLEAAYLTIYGELPNKEQYEQWVFDITHHTMIHENMRQFLDGFRYDAHPMGMFISTVAAESTFYPEAKNVYDQESVELQTRRLVAKVPTIAAFAHRHSLGLPYAYPDNDLSYVGNFLNMMFKMTETKYKPNPIIERALEILWILHIDHEQNCSTTTMRVIGSAEADPYVAVAGASAALSGPLHGGANERVLRMLDKIGSVENIPDYLKYVESGKEKLMGFGHRVYKNYDPRARIIKEFAHEVFKVTGRNPMLDIALELEKRALNEEYFAKRKLYPNVDFYSGIIYQALDIPTEMFTVMFAIPRTVGWLAQWREMLQDREQKIARPRQIYDGYGERAFVEMDAR
jgi:citrate synthase